MNDGTADGNYVHFGVREFGMAAICNGLGLHGGFIPYNATFLVFADYARNAVRMSALIPAHNIHVYTHDSIGLGEDGPTHQPVEHEAQLRLLEQLRNHNMQRSLLALRPADAYETIVAWELALTNKHRPTALILSRQNIPDIPARENSTRCKDADEARKGAYVVNDLVDNPAVLLIGNGSEVSTLMRASEILLQEEGISSRVISVISEGLFRDQDTKYQKSILPDNIPKFGLTAGLPSTLYGLVGTNGTVHGLEHFGYSAPASVLDEKFGFTADNIVNEVKALLANNYKSTE